MAYGDLKELTRRTASDKILSDKTLILLKIQNMMDIKGILLQSYIKFLINNLQVVPPHLQISLLLKMKLCQTKS